MTNQPELRRRCETSRLTHGRIQLALHRFDAPTKSTTHALLLLHGLGEHSAEHLVGPAHGWPGEVFALDFTGHGDSTVPRGGGYTAEVLLADAAAALAATGPATVLGRGLGAWVALLVAGARADDVAGAVLCDGPGLAGGGSEPSSASVTMPFGLSSAANEHGASVRSPDPFALMELARYIRPSDYALSYLHLANERCSLDHPVAVCAAAQPEWLRDVSASAGVLECSLQAALSMFSR